MVRRARSRRGWALIDVIVGGVILGIGLAAVVSIAERSLAMQQRSEREMVAAQLMDGLLGEVLAVGVVDWSLARPTAGNFESPYEEWTWELDIDKQGLGDPYRVVALARDRNGAEFRVETLMAPRPEGFEEPSRMPETPIDRQAKYDELP
jgi:hypothetical protein